MATEREQLLEVEQCKLRPETTSRRTTLRNLVFSISLVAAVFLTVPTALRATQQGRSFFSQNHLVELQAITLVPTDSRSADPPLISSSATPCATQQVFSNVGFTWYGQPTAAQYTPDLQSCPTGWGQIVLTLTGSVSGVQFDRYGAVWFRGVEVLRLTTPEPTAWTQSGLNHWQVDQDVTEYASLFNSPGQFVMDIPNIVDGTYTGVITIDVSLSFYAPGQQRRLRTSPIRGLQSVTATETTVLPLRNISEVYSGGGDPLNAITNTGRVGQVNLVTMPQDVVQKQDVVQLRLDVYASAHQCDEFWYANSPDGAPNAGCSVGGSYRELQVWVDGVLAGATIPFPAIYTGGFNPYLWMPLAGIDSLNLPPYSFDLSPFLGSLMDGQVHNITLAVYNQTSFWLLSGVLVLQRNSQLAPVTYGAVQVVSNPQFTSKATLAKGTQTMSATRSYNVKGSLSTATGVTTFSQVQGSLSASITNVQTASKSALSVTLSTSRTTSVNGVSVTAQESFPMSITSTRSGLELKQARSTSATFAQGTQGSAYYSLYNNISAAVGTKATSKEGYQIRAGSPTAAYCYNRNLEALNGAVSKDLSPSFSCPRNGVYVCGGKLCGTFPGPGGSGHMDLHPATEKENAKSPEPKEDPVTKLDVMRSVTAPADEKVISDDEVKKVEKMARRPVTFHDFWEPGRPQPHSAKR